MAKLTASQERDIIENFVHKLGGKAQLTSRTMRRYEPPTFDPYGSYKNSYYAEFHTYEEQVVELELPLSKFKDLAENAHDIEDLRARYGPNIDQMGMEIMREDFVRRNEAAVRRNNPAVQKAWEKYQMMLKIAGG